MSNKVNSLSEVEIDELVEAQADDDSAWEEAVQVRKSKPAALSLPSELAARAAFFARLHGAARVEEWLTHVIQERIRFEEAAFAEVKRDLMAKSSK